MTIDYTLLPEGLREGMQRYIEDGVKPGSFLQAVIANDFQMAVLKADADNINNLRHIALFMVNDAPAVCHGSRVFMSTWIEKGGLKGEAE